MLHSGLKSTRLNRSSGHAATPQAAVPPQASGPLRGKDHRRRPPALAAPCCAGISAIQLVWGRARCHRTSL